jgi:cytoskeletal protein CcmA (bactofilin family)
VSITGASPIAGDVNSTGGVFTSGSARVMGNINASGYVDISASAHYEGDIRTTGDIDLRNTATIYGSVSSNGSIAFNNGAKVGGNALAGGNIAFNNSGARVGGDARAGGAFTRGHGDSSTVHVAGSTTDDAGAVNNLAVPSEECDPIGIGDIMNQFSHLPSSGNLSTGYPFNSWQLTPTGILHYDETWNVKQWTPDAARVAHQVEVFGRDTTMFKVGNLNLGNGELRVTGGHVTIFVTGDLTLGTGGGKGLTIDEGSSLTVFVVGKTKIGSSVKMANRRPVNADGVPTFSLFSSYVTNAQGSLWDTQSAGVVVEGDSQLTASVYAPSAKVSITAGGNLLGAVRGRWVDVPGGAGMHFDEALADVDMGGSSGSTDGEAAVAILSRR